MENESKDHQGVISHPFRHVIVEDGGQIFLRKMRPWLFDPDHGSYSRRHNVIIVQLVVGHRRRIGMSGQDEVLKLVQTTRVCQLCEETPLMN